jgi:hypothetical protein
VRREFARTPRLRLPIFLFIVLPLSHPDSLLYPSVFIIYGFRVVFLSDFFLSSSVFFFYGSCIVSLSFLGFWCCSFFFSLSIVIFRVTTVSHHLAQGDSTCIAILPCHSYPALPLLYHTAFLFMLCFIICVLHSIPISVLSSALHLSLLFSSFVHISFAVVCLILYATICLRYPFNQQ